MFRYVALVWDGKDRGAGEEAQRLAGRLQESSPAWQSVLRAEGLAVLCRGMRPGSSEAYLLDGGAGVVLGKLFLSGDAPATAAPPSFSEPETLHIVTSEGRRLIERYWGRYVAFVRDAGAGKTWVLRDPAGMLPCFTMRVRGVDLYFSHTEEGARLGDTLTIDWDIVTAAICVPRIQALATGIREISQVLGGECVESWQGRTSRRFLWNPLSLAADEAGLIEDPAQAAAMLRDLTRYCTAAWASCYPSLIHLLSGGLDSSILMACLRDLPRRPAITCLNFYSPGSNTDERAYAHLAAQGSDCELLEYPRDAEVKLEAMLGMSKSCVPMDYFFYLDGGRREARLAAERGAGAMFSGYGGDQLFYQSNARFAASDYLARHGAGRDLFAVALDAARVDGLSVWTVLGAALKERLTLRRRRIQDDIRGHQGLLKAEVIEAVASSNRWPHPLFHEPSEAPNGKARQAYQLGFPTEFYHPLGEENDPENVTPLLSQPLLELVMRIPLWVMIRGGWDRALARRAFQRDVPREIILRRAKGGQEEHARTILVRNIEFARSLLLEGKLIHRGILDRTRVEDVLSDRPSTRTSNIDIFTCLSIEAWLLQWQR